MNHTNRWKDCFVGLLGIAIFFAILLLILYLERLFLERWVTPAEGLSLPIWLEEYGAVQFHWVFVVSAALAAAWVLVTSFLDSGLSGDRRAGWGLLCVLAVIVAFYAAFFRLPDSSAGSTLAIFVTILNGTIAFWLMTALTSPQTHKFSPVLSSYLRRGW